MTDASAVKLPVFQDERGTLVAAEFEQLPLTVRRMFVVTGTARGSTRGNHPVPCRELLILISGRVTVELGADEHSLAPGIVLDSPGEALSVPKGEFIRYHLADGQSTLAVLADEPHLPEACEQ